MNERTFAVIRLLTVVFVFALGAQNYALAGDYAGAFRCLVYTFLIIMMLSRVFNPPGGHV